MGLVLFSLNCKFQWTTSPVSNRIILYLLDIFSETSVTLESVNMCYNWKFFYKIINKPVNFINFIKISSSADSSNQRKLIELMVVENLIPIFVLPRIITNSTMFVNVIGSPNEWSAGAASSTTKNCYGETAPMSGTTYPGAYPDQMRVVDAVIRDMRNPAYLLDITMLSELRKDGHPSIYSGDLSPGQKANPDRSADCSHWCLPGLPDTWNQLFYAASFY